jgi:hypothetical protein
MLVSFGQKIAIFLLAKALIIKCYMGMVIEKI